MGVVYRVDVMKFLKEHGWSSYRLRNEKIFGNKTLQDLREGTVFTMSVIEKICEMTGCQPGDLLEYIPDELPESDE